MCVPHAKGRLQKSVSSRRQQATQGKSTSLQTQEIQYSPKIMHAQEVAEEVLTPQEHASGEKKLNCPLSTRSSTCKKIKILSARSRKKLRVLPQTANNRKKFTVVCLISNRQIQNHVYGKHKQQNVILILLLFLLRKDKKHLHVFRTSMQAI